MMQALRQGAVQGIAARERPKRRRKADQEDMVIDDIDVAKFDINV